MRRSKRNQVVSASISSCSKNSKNKKSDALPVDNNTHKEVSNITRPQENYEIETMVDSRAKQNIVHVSKQPINCSIVGYNKTGLAPDHRCASADCYAGIHNICAQINELASDYNELSMYCSIFLKR